jgi:hypothetical protein
MYCRPDAQCIDQCIDDAEPHLGDRFCIPSPSSETGIANKRLLDAIARSAESSRA